jgi:hypothetical protein
MTRKIWIITSIPLLIIFSTLISGQGIYQNKDPFLIYGYVTDPEGKTVAYANVTVIEIRWDIKKTIWPMKVEIQSGN